MSGEESTPMVDNFTNDSSMMIAYERSQESKRGGDALFNDPFAAALAGEKGESLSNAFGSNCHYFGFNGWTDFHKTWTVVRTKYIDDEVRRHASTGRFRQCVNLGAGMDTRAYRLECYQNFSNGSFEVDMETVNANKTKVFQEILGNPKPFSPAVHTVSLDFLSEETSLLEALGECGSFDTDEASIFISEGLIMYLGEVGKLKLLREISTVAAPGSVLILQFMEDPANNSSSALSTEEATHGLQEGGWEALTFSRFGDEVLNYGRFPIDKFEPSLGFSFVTCKKREEIGSVRKK